MRRHLSGAMVRSPYQLLPGAAWLILSLSPNHAAAQNDDERQRQLRQEWFEIQLNEDRDAKRIWWQSLNLEQLSAYIGAGADVNVADKRRWTPLQSGARYSSEPEVLLRLLEAGADTHARNRAGETPLHWAAAENPVVAMVHLLIQAGAKVNAMDRFGWLPLHTAAENNANPEVIQALLVAGAKRHRRAYFIFFGPAFLLKHNPNLSESEKESLIAMLKGSDQPLE